MVFLRFIIGIVSEAFHLGAPLATTEEKSKIAHILSSVRDRVANEEPSFISQAVLVRTLILVSQIRSTRWSRFRRVFLISLTLLTAFFLSVEIGSITGEWREVQSSLPWHQYEATGRGAQSAAKLAFSTKSEPKDEQIERVARQLFAYNENLSEPVLMILGVAITIVIALVMAGVWRISLWLAHHILLDLAPAPKATSLLFAGLGTYVLRLSVVSICLSFLYFLQYPPFLILFTPFIREYVTLLLSGNIWAIWGGVGIGVLSRLTLPDWLIFCLRAATFPLELLEMVLLLVFVLWILRRPLKELAVRSLDHFARKSRE